MPTRNAISRFAIMASADTGPEGRYIGDIWGIQMNFDVAVPAMIHAQYNRGASWLARLRHSLKGRPALDSIQKF